jgi:hypothetical protein
LLLRLGCVALLAWIGYIHLHLWQEGYRQIPTNGPLFLLDAVAGFVLAAVLLVWPRPLAGLVAAGYTAATLGALLISLSVGLFGLIPGVGLGLLRHPIPDNRDHHHARPHQPDRLAGLRPRPPARRTTTGRPASGRRPRFATSPLRAALTP